MRRAEPEIESQTADRHHDRDRDRHPVRRRGCAGTPHFERSDVGEQSALQVLAQRGVSVRLDFPPVALPVQLRETLAVQGDVRIDGRIPAGGAVPHQGRHDQRQRGQDHERGEEPEEEHEIPLKMADPRRARSMSTNLSGGFALRQGFGAGSPIIIRELGSGRHPPRARKHIVKKGKLAVIAVIAVLVVAFLWFDLGHYLSLEFLKSRQSDIDAFYREHPVTVLAAYFGAYVAITGLSLPGAAIMTLAGGAVFGLLWGTVVVSFASTLGATVAFIVSRYILRDGIQRRYGDRLKTINAGVERDGGFYLFTLRLVPAFPFFVINLVMGLTPMRTLTFALVSQLGMLPGTIVYVNAGTQLGRIDSLQGILSPTLIGSFVLLGIFPLLAKWVVGAAQARRNARRVGGVQSGQPSRPEDDSL